MNIISPYRIPIYRELQQVFDVWVILSGREDNRQWAWIDDREDFHVKTAWGFTVKRQTYLRSSRIYNLRYMHINPGYIWDLLKLRPHAVISIEMGFRSCVTLAYGFLLRKPVWIWWGGTIHTEQHVSPLKQLLRRHFFAPYTHRWISYGSSSTEYLVRLGVPRPRILQVQNGVDDSRFSATGPAMALNVPRPRILFVGQLIARKGLGYLLEAAGKLTSSHIPFSLIIVGDGPEKLDLMQQAFSLGLIDVCWISHIKQESMPLLYRACDVLVFPTLEDVWGLVVNEALLCGLPVLVSRYAGCAEELVPKENIFDPLDIDAFTTLLARTVENGSPPVNPGRIAPIHDVAHRIITDIEATLQGR